MGQGAWLAILANKCCLEKKKFLGNIYTNKITRNIYWAHYTQFCKSSGPGRSNTLNPILAKSDSSQSWSAAFEGSHALWGLKQQLCKNVQNFATNANCACGMLLLLIMLFTRKIHILCIEQFVLQSNTFPLESDKIYRSYHLVRANFTKFCFIELKSGEGFQEIPVTCTWSTPQLL